MVMANIIALVKALDTCFPKTNNKYEIDDDDPELDWAFVMDDLADYLKHYLVENIMPVPELTEEQKHVLFIAKELVREIITEDKYVNDVDELTRLRKGSILIVSTNLNWRHSSGYQFYTVDDEEWEDMNSLRIKLMSGYENIVVTPTTHPRIIHVRLSSHDVPTGTNTYIISFRPILNS